MESIRQKRDFFQFRVSVFIEKKLEDKTSQSSSYVKGTSYIRVFFFTHLYQSKGNCFEY